jgi:hypothetical protein
MFPLDSKVIGLDPMKFDHQRLVEAKKAVVGFTLCSNTSISLNIGPRPNPRAGNDSYHYKGEGPKRGE